MKSKIAAFFLVAALLLPMQFMSGCKTQKPDDLDCMPSATFNDEHYVWENFYFSTNQVKSTNQK